MTPVVVIDLMGESHRVWRGIFEIPDFTKKQCGIWYLTTFWEVGFTKIRHGVGNIDMKRKWDLGFLKKVAGIS